MNSAAPPICKVLTGISEHTITGINLHVSADRLTLKLAYTYI